MERSALPQVRYSASSQALLKQIASEDGSCITATVLFEMSTAEREVKRPDETLEAELAP
jgi:hypothetical protein